MQFLKYSLNLRSNEVVIVTLDRQANVRLMDSQNFARYRRGGQYRYVGGLATSSPCRIPAPCSGQWTLAVDLGGYPGSVRAAVNTVSC